MLQFIEKKRTEARVEPEPERSSDSEESRDPAAEPRLKTPAKVAIYWMFDELDVSPMDRQLSSEEMSSFLTEVQREVDPRACAESMKSYCDYNEDGMISLSEWCWCSGLDNSKFLLTSYPCGSFIQLFISTGGIGIKELGNIVLLDA